MYIDSLREFLILQIHFKNAHWVCGSQIIIFLQQLPHNYQVCSITAELEVKKKNSSALAN